MITRPSYQITSHPLGSLKEIWTLSWPLILGFVSNGMMVFVDRVMLGYYSLSAMNASATAGGAAFSFLVLPMVIAGISEVFVGKFNGENKPTRIGSAVWQMIWFSIFLIPLFYIIGLTMPGLLFKHAQSPALSAEYFFWLMALGVVFCLSKAVLGFYVGQGKVAMIAVAVLAANILNVGLDYLLIFGSKYTPSLGIKGAAIATVSTEAMMFLAFFFFFIRKKNREEKGTGRYQIKAHLFFKSVKIGFSASLAHLSEYVSYFIFISLLNQKGKDFLTIMVILQTFYMIVFFVVEGISKGVTAVVSNLIGAKKYEFISKSVRSTFKLHMIFVAVTSFVVIFCSPGIFSIFAGHGEENFFSNPVFLSQLHKSSVYMCLFYMFDGMLWVFVGVLVAAQDNRFVMIAGTLGPFILSLAPIYIAVTYFNATVDKVWLILACYSFCFLGVYFWRYLKSPWRQLQKELPAPSQEEPALD